MAFLHHYHIMCIILKQLHSEAYSYFYIDFILNTFKGTLTDIQKAVLQKVLLL